MAQEIKQKKVILIVDDDKILQNVLSKTFIDAGYKVLSAYDGKEGVDMALDKKPDLIFIDMLMPVMDGLDMVNHLRTDDWGKTVKIVILTNADDVKILKDAVAVQGCEYMVKSDWSMDQVVEKANTMLKDS